MTVFDLLCMELFSSLAQSALRSVRQKAKPEEVRGREYTLLVSLQLFFVDCVRDGSPGRLPFENHSVEGHK
jgi:hypothetical protein